MHYNYASLQHAFELLDREWDNLYKASDNDYDKILLVRRQLIGFEMRRLPGIDRCVMAQGLFYVIDKKEVVGRSYTLREAAWMAESFPVTTTDDSIGGLGGDFSVDVFGVRRWAASVGPRVTRAAPPELLENLCRTKTSNLQNLCTQPQLISRAGVY